RCTWSPMIPKVSRGLRTLSMGESQPGSNTTGHGPNRHALGSIERMAFFSRCAIRTSNCPNGPVALHAQIKFACFRFLLPLRQVVHNLQSISTFRLHGIK